MPRGHQKGIELWPRCGAASPNDGNEEQVRAQAVVRACEAGSLARDLASIEGGQPGLVLE